MATTTDHTYWHGSAKPHRTPRSISRTIRSLSRAFTLFKALAFGNYIHSTGGPDDFDDGVVFSHDGQLHKWCEPVPVVDPHQLLAQELAS